jgi:AraC-like DNA-binding protein
MHYQETAPPPDLADIVRCIWQLRGPAPESLPAPAEPALPDGSPELIINLGRPFEHIGPRGAVREQPEAFLVGQITRPFAVRPTGPVDLIAVRFEAHGAGMLHRPMHLLTDDWLPLDQLQRPEIATQLARLREVPHEQHVEVVVAQLAAIRAHAHTIDARVVQSVHAIRRSGGTVSLDALTAELRLTMRTLQRLFARDVGMAPKLLAQIVRFQRVFATARDNPRALSRVAQQCGYYDQAHLVRDFRRFGGDAPTRLLTALPQFTAFFTA